MADSEMTKEKQEALDKAFERNQPRSMEKPSNKDSNIKKVIGIVSGKGGVGKSIVTSMLAVLANRAGKKVAIIDADITGPSIPAAFGVHQKAYGIEEGILPVETASGIKIMSINLMLDNPGDPVIWRGPVIAGAVQQFWTDVVWGDIDVMFVDMPPGTGDVPLTVFQSIPVDGVIVVSSPQDLVEMIVSKAVKMATMMDIPVLGMVENMSYYECPNCHEKHEIYGPSKVKMLSEKYCIPDIARMPINPEFARLCDEGKIDQFSGDYLNTLFDSIM